MRFYCFENLVTKQLEIGLMFRQTGHRGTFEKDHFKYPTACWVVRTACAAQTLLEGLFVLPCALNQSRTDVFK